MKIRAVTILMTIWAMVGLARADSFRFTVTADPRSSHTAFEGVCDAINDNVGGPGMFHVSVGDVDPPSPNRAVIDDKFGAAAKWYPVIGNHECDTGSGQDIEWLRNEYDNGNDVRTPLSDPSMSNADGPVGSQRTCYTWDDPGSNSHFIALNEYWNGGTSEGSGQSLSGDDTGSTGDVVPALQIWLEADLIANQDKAVFVFGHEPAFPENRHVGDSLDKYAANRDAFWTLLNKYDVVAYICGHTHFYSEKTEGGVLQIDVGNAGNDPGDGLTFLDVNLLDGEVQIDVWRNKTGAWTLTESGVHAVPEPATMSLLALGGLGVLARRRRQRA